MPNLTPKEIEVLNWLAHGYTYEQIAKKMNIGVSTIKKHTSSSIQKMNAQNSTHACSLAVKWGLIR